VTVKIEHERSPIVLTLIGAFWPGSDSSGPNLSFRGMAEALGGEFKFRQVSRDRPFGAAGPLVEKGKWINRGSLEARYCPPTLLGAEGLAKILRNEAYDVLVLNGFYDQDFTIPTLIMRKIGHVPRVPTILSPRGEFAAGAMSLKSGRKSGWRALARRTGLLADLWLHGTSEAEIEDIRRAFPWARGYLVAPNVRELIDPAPREPQTDGVKRLAFVGRISRVKNLDYALKVLTEVKGRVAFDIYGPVEDAGYWAHCQKIIASTPPNVTVAYKGEIANAAVPGALATADLLFLPTKGENFGHAIFEALSCGVPVLIANTTPWRGLAALSAGWDLPLTDPAEFSGLIDQFVAMGADQHTALREGARRLAKQSILDGDAAGKARTMLRSVLTIQRNGAAA